MAKMQLVRSFQETGRRLNFEERWSECELDNSSLGWALLVFVSGVVSLRPKQASLYRGEWGLDSSITVDGYRKNKSFRSIPSFPLWPDMMIWYKASKIRKDTILESDKPGCYCDLLVAVVVVCYLLRRVRRWVIIWRYWPTRSERTERWEHFFLSCVSF